MVKFTKAVILFILMLSFEGAVGLQECVMKNLH